MLATRLDELFPKRFYIELQRAGLPAMKHTCARRSGARGER